MDHTEKLSRPLCSVIIPVYNVERFLSSCLDSILQQTYENLEVLVVDDGSTDGSKEILNTYAKQDAKVRAYFQDHLGVSAARNCGLQNARGEWIVFIDSDDLLCLNAIEDMISAALDADVPVVCVSLQRNDETIVYPGVCTNHTAQRISQKELVSFQLDCPATIRTGVTGKLFSRDLIQDQSFREDLHSCEDSLFMMEASLKTEYAVFMPGEYYIQRVHEGSTMNGGLSSKAYAYSLSAHLEIAEMIRKAIPDLDDKAFYSYVDVCIWKRRKVMMYPDTQSAYYARQMRKAVRDRLFKILGCHTFSFRQKIWMVLYSFGFCS